MNISIAKWISGSIERNNSLEARDQTHEQQQLGLISRLER